MWDTVSLTNTWVKRKLIREHRLYDSCIYSSKDQVNNKIPSKNQNKKIRYTNVQLEVRPVPTWGRRVGRRRKRDLWVLETLCFLISSLVTWIQGTGEN